MVTTLATLTIDANKYEFETIKTNDVFRYARVCELIFEKNMETIKGGERLTTFYSDLSIAELFGHDAVLDTCKRVLKEWMSNEKYIAELSLSINWKSWEHYSRGNEGWSSFFSDLYYAIDEVIMDAYKDNQDKLMYYIQYID